jgi:hypothetical protein
MILSNSLNEEIKFYILNSLYNNIEQLFLSDAEWSYIWQQVADNLDKKSIVKRQVTYLTVVHSNWT